MWRRHMWGLLVMLTAGCMDFREGLACSSDADCDGYYCTAGVCRKSETDHPASGRTVTYAGEGAEKLRVDATSLYWLNVPSSGPTFLGSVSKAGGTASSIDLGGSDLTVTRSSAFAVDGGMVYIGVGGTSPGLVAVNIGALTAQDIVFTATMPEHLVFDASSLFWAARPVGSSSYSLFKMARGGGAVTTLASNLDLASTKLVIANGLLYWADCSGIRAVSVGGGTPTRLAPLTCTYWVNGLAVLPDGVLFSQQGVVKKVPLAGGAAVQVVGLQPPFGSPYEFETDGSYVYWSGLFGTEYGLLKTPVGGGAGRVLLDLAWYTGELAVDGQFVFFLDESASNIPLVAVAK